MARWTTCTRWWRGTRAEAVRLLVALVPIALLAVAPAARAGDPLVVELRASPRVARAPAEITFTVELKAGEESEAIHCLTLEWTWGDGARSTQDADCRPYRETGNQVQRVFQATHTYREKGQRRVAVVVRKGERVLGKPGIDIRIGPPATKLRMGVSGSDR
jgi:hypothetical protein